MQLHSSHAHPPHRDWSRPLAIIGLLIALLALGRIASHEFVEWDDGWMLARNARFNPPTVKAVFAYALPKNAELYLYIPVTEFCWGGLAALGYLQDADATGSHLNPLVFHSASIAVHLLGAVLVFLCLREMLRITFPNRSTVWPSWVGAMIFAVHPLQVEAVAWASGFKDVLAGFFVLGCTYCFIRFRAAQTGDEAVGNQRPLFWYTLGTVCLLLANLSKAGAVAMPMGMFVIDCVLLRTSLRRSVTALWPWFVMMIPIIVVARIVQQYGWTDIAPTPIYLRPFVAGDALAFYIAKTLCPLHLAVDYGRRPAVVLRHWPAYIDWLIPVAVGAICLRAKEHRLLLAGFLFALALLLPVLGFVPFGSQEFSTVADHYMYPSMLGVSMISAWLISRFTQHRLVHICCLLLLGILSVIAFQTAGNWRDNEALARHALSVNPDSWNAMNSLSVSLARQGDLAGAETNLVRSIDLNNRNGMAHFNLANIYLREGRVNDAMHELREMTRVYQFQSNSDRELLLQANLAIAAIMLKNHHPELAIEPCRAALAIDPTEPRALALLKAAQSSAPAHTQ